MKRTAVMERTTKETKIRLSLCLDGTGKGDIHTGIGFFDHMLEGFARHGLFDLSLFVEGDLQVDTHHTIEDTGIVLGRAIKEAVGDKKGMVRYGSMILPMDEALILCALDLCGRPYLVYDLKLDRERRNIPAQSLFRLLHSVFKTVNLFKYQPSLFQMAQHMSSAGRSDINGKKIWIHVAPPLICFMTSIPICSFSGQPFFLPPF